MGDAMANRQLRQMHREANTAILEERPIDPGDIQDSGTRPSRNRTAKNTCVQSGERGCRDGKSGQTDASINECGYHVKAHPN